MFEEDTLLPLSALQHLIFCERQCALIHLEGVWADNALTVEGTHLHRRVDEEGPRHESRVDLRITRGLALRSLRLGLTGRADIVELHRIAGQEVAGAADANDLPAGIALPGAEGLWCPYPVEYKRGKPKRNSADRVQLCAQALCLEEMLAVQVPSGALFYGMRKRRLEVAFDADLRSETERAAARLHELMSEGRTPRAVREPKCEKCSLLELCMPDAVSSRGSARSYLERALTESGG